MPVIVCVGPPGRGPLFRPRRRWRSTVLPIPSAPGTPSSPSPANGGTALYSLLSWSATGATKFDLYFGTTATPPLVVPYYVGTTYTPVLVPGTTYFWQIVARNDGGSTAGPIWSFITPSATSVLFLLDGVLANSQVMFPSLAIRDVLGAAPNVATMLIKGAVPPHAGSAIQIGLGSLDPSALIFGGELQVQDQTYVGTPLNNHWPVSLIDHTFSLNKRRPFGAFVNQSATAIGKYLVANYAPPGFSDAGIVEGLPTLSINFDGKDDFMSCMGQLASGINGRTKVDYNRVVKLFLTEVTDAPDPIDADHRPLNDPQPLRFSTGLSQVRTRVYGKGHGEKLLSDVNAGEWILPVPDSVMYNVLGGHVIVGITADAAQTIVLAYAGIHRGGGGGLVGPGASPSSSPAATLNNGTEISTGAHDYAISYVTASGESLVGPRRTITVGINQADLAGPSAIGTLENDDGSRVPSPLANPIAGHSYQLVYTWKRSSDNVETLPSPPTNAVVADGHAVMIQIGGLQYGLTGPPGYTGPIFYISDNGSAYQKLPALEIHGLYITFTWANGTLGAAPPSVNRVALSAISIGVSSVTQRKVYRTALGSSQLKLVATIADNTTTTYVDSTPDASLGANAPTSDASGLSQPSGQSLAGSNSLIVAGTSEFDPNGGWAIIGNGQQVIRYTQATANALSGIPTSGPGSIVASVSWNSTVTAAPALTGLNANNGIPVALAKGAKVQIWIQRDDLAAQAALGILERNPDGTPTDGIREYTITDERRGEASLIDLCDADLARFSRPIISATYSTRDPKTRAGKTVHIDAQAGGIFDPAIFDPAIFDVPTTWGLTGDFVIQDVTITFDGPALLPRYAVQASSAVFSFADLLRRVLVT